MPPKQNYTKEAVLQAAEKIMMRNGFETVNARSLAKELGCSTQPIYSYFADMKALKNELYNMVVNQFMEKINTKKDDDDFLNYATKTFILTAKNESHLFRFIYNSHNFDGKSMEELLSEYETNRLICERLIKDYSLSEKQGHITFYKIWFFIYGISTMLATNKLNISDSDVFELVQKTIADILKIKGSGELV
jgi:AcrR family transcriptional regulator